MKAPISALCLAITTPLLPAAVTITFDDSGPDVIATVSGSLDMTRFALDIDNGGVGNQVMGGNGFLFTVQDPNGEADVYGVGNASVVGLNVAPSTGMTTTFGFDGGSLYIPASQSSTGTYTVPAGSTYVWSGAATLADIGLGSLTTTPTVAFNIDGVTDTNDAIFYVRSVPEPGTSVFFGLALFGGLLRRRRRVTAVQS